MRNEVKIRLLKLGKKQIDLMDELNKRGLNVAQSQLSDSLSGRLQSPKGTKIRTECLYILDEWEKGANV
jgi:hypothetical protein